MGAMSLPEASGVVSAEKNLLAILDATATSSLQFEENAQAVEDVDLDDEHFVLTSSQGQRELHGSTEALALQRLEVGVSGLAHALCVIGAYPAASCRSHGPKSWSPCPVVYFAAPEVAVRRMVSTVHATTGVGFLADPERPELHVLGAVSTVARLFVEATSQDRIIGAVSAENRRHPRTNLAWLPERAPHRGRTRDPHRRDRPGTRSAYRMDVQGVRNWRIHDQ